jgi:two-component system KDP operon response regulator KdpE
MTLSARVLIIDDEPSVRVMLDAALRPLGYRVEVATNGREALRMIDKDEYDLLLLDLRLGDLDGIEVLRETKARWPNTEVILLTAHGSINSAISALRYGAFDYLLKPAQVTDIRERVERGLSRRRSSQQRSELLQRISESARALGVIDGGGDVATTSSSSDRLEVGPLVLDLRRHRATVGSTVLSLTRTEFSLLTVLAQQPDTALSYSALSEAIYGRAQPEDEARALLRPHIARLRHKLEGTGMVGVALVSIRSMGYMLRTEL